LGRPLLLTALAVLAMTALVVGDAVTARDPDTWTARLVAVAAYLAVPAGWLAGLVAEAVSPDGTWVAEPAVVGAELAERTERVEHRAA
jgi:hypothetical protein